MSVKKAVVVDPNPLWRKATELVLRLNEVEVAATTDSLGEAARLIDLLRPDLAVIEPEHRIESRRNGSETNGTVTRRCR